MGRIAAALVVVAASACADPPLAAPEHSAPTAPITPLTSEVTRVDSTAPESSSSESTSATTPASTAPAPAPTSWRVDWIGGSDVALREVSLPDEFSALVHTVDARPVEAVAVVLEAAMPDDIVAAISHSDADAMLVSLNPVWLTWDGVSCAELTEARPRYRCLLDPTRNEEPASGVDGIRLIVEAAANASVPVYLYLDPISHDALADPALRSAIDRASNAIASLDPRQTSVRVVATSLTTDLPTAAEGVEFFDAVHPTAAGAAAIAAWLAADVCAWLAGLDRVCA